MVHTLPVVPSVPGTEILQNGSSCTGGRRFSSFVCFLFLQCLTPFSMLPLDDFRVCLFYFQKVILPKKKLRIEFTGEISSSVEISCTVNSTLYFHFCLLSQIGTLVTFLSLTGFVRHTRFRDSVLSPTETPRCSSGDTDILPFFFPFTEFYNNFSIFFRCRRLKYPIQFLNPKIRLMLFSNNSPN